MKQCPTHRLTAIPGAWITEEEQGVTTPMAAPATGRPKVPARDPTASPILSLVVTSASICHRLADGPRPALGEGTMLGVRPAVVVLTAPAGLNRSLSRKDSIRDSTAGEDVASGGKSVASRRTEI